MKKKLAFCLLLAFCHLFMFSLENINSRVNLLSFDTSLQNYFPIGRYGMYSSYNYGLTSQLNMNLKDFTDFRLFTAISLSNNTVILDDIDYIVDMYFVFGVGYNFNMDSILPFKGLNIAPGGGYGWMPHLARGGYWTDGEQQTHFFQDQIIMAQLEFSYELKHIFKGFDYTVLLTPSYVHFLEEEYDGQEIGFNIGLRVPIDNTSTGSRTLVENPVPAEPVVIRDEIKPELIENNDQRIDEITPSTVTISMDPVKDDTTPDNKIIYRTFIVTDDNYIVDNIEEFTTQSIGTPQINIENLSPGTKYYAHTIALDNANNFVEYIPVDFKTTEMINSTTGFNIGNNAIEVDLRKVLEVEFNSDINPETIDPETVYVKSGDYYIKGELQYKDRILKFIPQEDFLQGKKHDFVLTTGIADFHGNTMKKDSKFSFTALDYNDIFAHWKFDGNTYDSSGNNHTAALKSVKTDKLPTFINIDELGNGGLHFVGGYNWGTYIDLGTIDMGDKFTIAGWVKIEEPPAEYSQKIMTLISNGDAGARKDGFKVFFNNWSKDDKRIVIETGNGTNYRNSETQDDFIAYNNWYHVAVTIDRTIGIVKLYFNGNEAETTNNGAIMNDFNTNAPLHIGHFKDGFYHYNGYIDDFRIYKKVITAEDIETIARGK